MNLNLYLTPDMKINSKWIKDLNVKAKTIKLIEENIGVNLYTFGLGNGVIDVTPKAQATKEKIDKLDFIKIQNFCAANDTIKKVKRQPKGWVKIFANHVSNKGLAARID